MKRVKLYIISCVFAALSPILYAPDISITDNATFPGWPDSINGIALSKLPLTELEKSFADSFPGKTGRFTDKEKQYIIRWVTKPTRKLHPALDCFKASGYKIKYMPYFIDKNNIKWSSFEAKTNDQTLLVREHIHDMAGNSWADISQWYWEGTMRKSDGPWWSITSVERKGSSKRALD